MKKSTVLFLSVILLLTFSAAAGLVIKNRVQTKVKDLFRLNATLQEEGYYMAEFEFRLMGIVYYLDRGKYHKALSVLSSYHEQLKNRKNLMKIPEKQSKTEEIEFYLNLQNPRTGAFMDDTFPYCTFNEPTENVVAHLELLSRETGRPLKLKYPLKYLDEINSPGKLTTFLEDVSHAGFFGSRFPQTTYVFARSVLSYMNGESVIIKNNLYTFSPGFRKALINWFYNDQDSVTGFWGPRSRKNNQLIKIDLTNTASVIKTFADNEGNNIYEDYPLRYSSRMIETALKVLSGPVPEDDEPDEIHEWNLSMGKGIYMVLRYLWKYASEEEKEKAKSIIEDYIRIKFDKYYIQTEGAFRYYPGAEHASLDGTGSAASLFKEVGAFSPEKQKKLWGDPSENILDLGSLNSTEIKNEDLKLIKDNRSVNSLRIYYKPPDYRNLTDGVKAIAYPDETSVPDIMELVPKIKKWSDRQSLTIGNWTSMEDIKSNYAFLDINEIPVIKELDTDTLNNIFQSYRQLHIVGFDILQVPRCRITRVFDDVH